VGNALHDEEYNLIVRTLGSGEGIDRPAGTWPDLHESWMPVWFKSCTKCPERLKENEKPYCAYNCPNGALIFGEDVDTALAALREAGFRIWQLPAWEKPKEGIYYASK